MMRARHAVSALILLCAVAASGSARASGVDPAKATAVEREQAQQRFLKGKALYEKNDMQGALDEFRASLDIVASPNTRLYVARSLRELGRLVEAYAEFGRTAADAKEHEREDGRYGKAAQAATDERAAIAPQIGFLLLTIRNPSDATNVTIAGTPLVRAGWADPVPVKPGDVDVEVDSPGVAPIHKHLSVSAGSRVPIDVDAHAVGSPTPVAPTPVPLETPAPHRRGQAWMLPAAIAGAGVGVVGLVIFTVAGVASNGTYSDLQKQCGAGPCPASFADEVSRGKTEQAIANTGLVVGLVGLAAGATFFTLWLFPPKPLAASASIVVGPGSLGVAGTF